MQWALRKRTNIPAAVHKAAVLNWGFPGPWDSKQDWWRPNFPNLSQSHHSTKTLVIFTHDLHDIPEDDDMIAFE